MGCVSEALYLKIILPNLIQRTDEMLHWTKTLGLKEKSKQLKFNPWNPHNGQEEASSAEVCVHSDYNAST